MKTSAGKAVAGALLLLCPMLVFAQDAGGTEAVQTVLRSILSDTSSLISGSPFMAQGQKLLQMLLVILISWKGIKLALDVSGYSQVVAEIVNIVLLWGIASFFLTATVQKQFADGFNDLAKTAASATGSTVDMSNPESAISNALGRMMHSAMLLYEGTPPEKPAAASASTWEKFTGWLKDKWSDLTSGQIFAGMAAAVFRIFIAVAVLITALIYVAQLIISQILVNIGLILAPLFVPWLMWESTAFIFHSWVKFMIVAGVQKIVGALLFGLTASMIAKVTTLASAANADPSQNFYYYAAAFLVVAIMALLMMQVTTIANGLVSGMPTTAFKPPMAMTAGGGMNRASGGMQKGASQAMSGARAGGRAAVGAYQGFKAGMSSGQGAAATARQAASGAWTAMKGGKATASAPSSLPKTGGKGGTP